PESAKKQDFTTTVPFGSSVIPDEVVEPKPTRRSFESTLAFGSSAEPKSVVEPKAAEPKVEEPKLEEPKRAESKVASTTTHEEAPQVERRSKSVPPGVAEKFFSDGDSARHIPIEAPEDALTIPDKVSWRREPAVIQRRERFVRYVKWAVAG